MLNSYILIKILNKIKKNVRTYLKSALTYFRLKVLVDEKIYNQFRNKNIVLYIPGEPINDDLLKQIEKADILVLVNKGYRIKNILDYVNGATKICLFHCLDQSEDTGGGVIDNKILNNIGIRELFYPFCEDRFRSNMLYVINKNKFNIHIIPRRDYEILKNKIDNFTPNTGFATFWVLFNSSPKSIYVHGMSFYRTGYNSPYYLKQHDEIIELIEHYGNHNPDCDFAYFKDLLCNAKNVTVSQGMRMILNEPFKRIFYKEKYNIKYD